MNADMDDLFDDPKKKRDAAFERMESHMVDWHARAMNIVKGILHFSWEGTGEDLRNTVYAYTGLPPHHNVWGAIIMKCIKQKILIPTGKYAHMKGKKSHARKTPIYRGWR